MITRYGKQYSQCFIGEIPMYLGEELRTYVSWGLDRTSHNHSEILRHWRRFWGSSIMRYFSNFRLVAYIASNGNITINGDSHNHPKFRIHLDTNKHTIKVYCSNNDCLGYLNDYAMLFAKDSTLFTHVKTD